MSEGDPYNLLGGGFTSMPLSPHLRCEMPLNKIRGRVWAASTLLAIGKDFLK